MILCNENGDQIFQITLDFMPESESLQLSLFWFFSWISYSALALLGGNTGSTERQGIGELQKVFGIWIWKCNYNLIYHSNSFIIVILQILIASLQYATEGPRALASLIYNAVNPNWKVMISTLLHCHGLYDNLNDRI